MQLKNSTDYAIRIVCYLAAQERMVSTSELSRKLNVSANYVPKIAKKLKNAKIVTACEGTNGGYMLAKQPENISLMEIISCVEETMAINRCLEEDRFCSRNLEDTCKIHKILLSLQKLTDEEMNVVKQHPLVGAAMTQRFPEGITTEKLNKYSYEICRHHHERYDGSGYPDGLKGNAIPMCAQVVGIVDAYDALINDRPYKRKYEPEEAIRMVSNGECGAFSNQLMQCFQEAAKQQNWLKRQN